MNLRLPAVLSIGLSVGLGGSMGCGLRSNPLAVDTDFTVAEADAPDEGDPGTCTNPFMLEGLADSAISGELAGAGNYEGWCGGDSGREDVYLFVTPENLDVTLRFDSSTSSDISVRVIESEAACQSGSEAATRLCDRSVIENGVPDTRYFYATGGVPYYIIVDNRGSEAANYSGVVTLDPPSIDVCAPHPDTITQVSGSTFTWYNDFSTGQGRVDGICGGPGKENFFRLQASYPGNVYINAYGSGGFNPIVGLRRGCGGTTEVSCTSADLAGTPGTASLSYFLDAGEWWVTVDDATVDGGAYTLEVYFE
jgi:hypothetical protein